MQFDMNSQYVSIRFFLLYAVFLTLNVFLLKGQHYVVDVKIFKTTHVELRST